MTFPHCECGNADSHFGHWCPAKLNMPVGQRVRHQNGETGTVTHINHSGAPDVHWDGDLRVYGAAEPSLITAIREELTTTTSPPGAYQVATYADIQAGDWFIDPATDDGFLFAATSALPAKAGPGQPPLGADMVQICCSKGQIDSSSRPINFYAVATAGIWRAEL